jgi:TolA-binding protein
MALGVAFCLGGVVGAVVGPRLARKEPVATSLSPAQPTPAGRKHHAGRASAPAATDLAAVPAVVPEAAPVVVAKVAPAVAVPDAPKPAVAPARQCVAARVAMVDRALAPSAPNVVPAPAPPAAAMPSAPPAPPAPAPPAEAPPSTPSPIAVEQALLGRAMKALRVGHDLEGALALLAEHEQRFPDGALASEATMLRVEALLGLGRKTEALSVLDRMSLATSPNRDEQFVLRGELRGAAGRWREARADFDEPLRGPLPAASAKERALQERALWGRAAARSRLGDETGARADLGLYLRAFSGGRFAAQAAALLEAAP